MRRGPRDFLALAPWTGLRCELQEWQRASSDCGGASFLRTLAFVADRRLDLRQAPLLAVVSLDTLTSRSWAAGYI